MKLILILMISILTLSVNGQIEPIQKKEAKVSLTDSVRVKKVLNDSIPLVEYVKPADIFQQTAYFINGKFTNPTILWTIDPQYIDSIYVEKTEIEINGKRYDGQLYFMMKKEYNPRLISLTDLRMKYTQLKNRSAIFMIDNDIIKYDYDQYLVDEKFILKIIADTIETENWKLSVDIIRLLTKSKKRT